jgi:hypothetical protein
MTGFEPVTSSLPRKHSTPELHRRLAYSENRFPESRRKTTIQFSIFKINFQWGEQDSNLRRFPNGFTVRPRWPLEYLP